jgi:hypothetical protein
VDQKALDEGALAPFAPVAAAAPASPEPLTALKDALEVLRAQARYLQQPETLGLYGAIHKRLWEINPAPELLDTGITAYARGFALKQDHYTGIDFAFLLDLRAREHLKAGQRDDAITDHRLAMRMRKDVAQIARATWSGCPRRSATSTSGCWPRCGNPHWAPATRWRWPATRPRCAR